MATRVRSHCKINLGLAVGPNRGDGFHALTTMYPVYSEREEALSADDSDGVCFLYPSAVPCTESSCQPYSAPGICR